MDGAVGGHRFEVRLPLGAEWSGVVHRALAVDTELREDLVQVRELKQRGDV